MKTCFLNHRSEEDPVARECSSDLVPRKELSSEMLRTLRLTARCKKSIKYVCRGHLKQYFHDYASHQHKCCDPFEDHAVNPPPAKKAKSKQGLSEINLHLRDRAKIINKSLIPGQKLCVACKIKLFSKLPKKSKEESSSRAASEAALAAAPAETTPTLSSQSVHSSQLTASTSGGFSPGNNQAGQMERVAEQLPLDTSTVDLEGLNTWLKNLGLTPISHRKIKRQGNYGEKVLLKLKAALVKCSTLQFKEDKDSVFYTDMIQQLKSYIQINTANSKKVLALTVLPMSMSYAKMEETFGVTNYMARKSRIIVTDTGILSEPGAKSGRRTSEETVNKVISFYNKDDVSRPLPGRKDVVSVKENGERLSKRKRLVLGTLGSLYSQYLEENPSHQVSRGKFCELRPKECVLAGQAGTHVICVCTYHENPSLMFERGHLKSENLNAVRDCRALMLCSVPERKCFLRQCENCPQMKLQETLQVHFDSEMIDSVTYNQWESTDRGNLLKFECFPSITK